MTSISIKQPGVCVDEEIYNKIVADLKAGKRNEIIRFILNNRNWVQIKHASIQYPGISQTQFVEDMVSFSQAKRLMNIYRTAIELLRYTTGRKANLDDDRTAAIMGHRGWYLDDYIFSPILEKIWKNTRNEDLVDLGVFYKRFAPQSNPKYDVVQSILMAKDFNEYLAKWNDAGFFDDKYTRANYMDDLQLVFDNIIKGRSIVLMEQGSINAFNKFGKFCCDKTNPYFKPEYLEKAKAAAAVVQEDWTFEKNRLAGLRQPNQGYNRGGYGRS